MTPHIQKKELSMNQPTRRVQPWFYGLPLLLIATATIHAQDSTPQLGRQVAIPVHLQDGEEFTTPIKPP